MNTTVRAPVIASILAVSLIAGCKANKVSRVGENAREAITYAARAKYPGNAQQSDQVRAVALMNSGTGAITVYNLSDRPIPANALWVNGNFVRQINTIPPNGNTSVTYAELIEAGAGVKAFSQSGASPQRVELQTGQGLYTVEGPVEE